MTQSLSQRVIIVTGAAGGIGSGTASMLARAGARIVVSDISEAGKAVADAIRAEGGEAIFVKADVSLEEGAADLVEKTIAQFGRIDGAFNNAGIEQHSLPLYELSAAQWDRVIRVDLTGVFFCLKHQILAMRATGGGAIVNTSSALGQVAMPDAAEYISAKHGVIGLTRAAALDCRALGIRVNAVLPGLVGTPMIRRLADDPALAPVFQRLREQHPLNRLAEPREIGDAVAWLLSDASSFVTGTTIAVDGGYMAV